MTAMLEGIAVLIPISGVSQFTEGPQGLTSSIIAVPS